jgi:hypothetical protein
MQCWVCGTNASGSCRVCGRAVCKVHAKTRAFLFESWQDRDELRGLVIEDALHCGVCKARAEPVPLDFLIRPRKTR